MTEDPVEVQISGRAVRVTNPGRVYFPALGLTKGDLVAYYCAVAEPITRALRDRPCMLRRFPTGLDGEDVYQKRVPAAHPDWLETVRVRFPSGRHADELCVTEPAAVIWAAQRSTIEFHPWHSRRADTERPDEMRIDLDPQPGTDFADARRVADGVHELLTELGLIGWPKTSGNRGIHVFVRIAPNWGFTEVRRAALAFGRELERRMPGDVTTKWWKEERGQKVFCDYNQNARDRTMASAYSVRALPAATVSTPFTWAELSDVDPQALTVATVPDRLAQRGDPQESIDDAACDISTLIEWAERDEVDRGLGDAPYPPNYPKMPGEPTRVAPSRARVVDPVQD